MLIYLFEVFLSFQGLFTILYLDNGDKSEEFMYPLEVLVDISGREGLQ